MTRPPLPEPDVVVDCLGRPCPVPVIELARALRDLPDDAVVEVVSDDPAALVDVPAFCRLRGHQHLGNLQRDLGIGQRVRRVARAAQGPARQEPDR